MATVAKVDSVDYSWRDGPKTVAVAINWLIPRLSCIRRLIFMDGCNRCDICCFLSN